MVVVFKAARLSLWKNFVDRLESYNSIEQKVVYIGCTYFPIFAHYLPIRTALKKISKQ
jgi:hypothetical protein